MEQQRLTLEPSDPSQPEALAPLNIIRTETVLSKLPVHNLAKKGKVDIRILRRTEGGELQLKWEVSHSDRYGQPRQLAYKLDTLIVNRRLDEEQRPLPTVVRIGSLKEICKEMGLHESGKNTKDLRLAFLQNASSFINAHLTWRGADGVERRLEAGFTRYGVVFTGENLSDGRRADAVYITLNQPYWEVVNSAPVRPLNYDYLKALTPAAQRFYEVVSYRIFAAFRNSRPQARLLYSDYCAFSAQQRYFDHEHFRVQMYKVHRPHLLSGYLKSISVSPTTDAEGNPDWTLMYTPGPKARVEFLTFTRKHRGTAAGPDPEQAETEAGQEGQGSEAETSDLLLSALIGRGITERRAKKLLAGIVPGQPVTDQLEWADTIVRNSHPGSFRNPPGFYFSVIRDNVRLPERYERTANETAENSAQTGYEDLAKRQEVEHRYEEYRRGQVSLHLSTLPPDVFRTLVTAKRKEYTRQYRDLPAKALEELSHSGARAELEKTLDLMSFEEFCSSGS